MTTYEFLQLCKRYNGGEGKYKAKCPCGCSRAYTLDERNMSWATEAIVCR